MPPLRLSAECHAGWPAAGRGVATELDRAEAELLASFSPQEQRRLRDLLTRLAAGQSDPASGCI